MAERRVVSVGAAPLKVEDVVDVATGKASLVLDPDPEFRARLNASVNQLGARLERGGRVYGVTTGFGEACLNEVQDDHVSDLPTNLMRFHGCGTGRILEPEESAAVVVSRVASLVTGWSATRPVVLEAMCGLLQAGLTPCIPAEGSVGASGDLTPLSYVAAAIMGEREVQREGATVPAADALAEAGLERVRLGPKESLAIMNGTSVMSALTCLAFVRARRVARAAAALTATASAVMRGNPAHFDDRIYAAKPHPGQRAFATWVREDLEYQPGPDFEGRIQDRYSIRCAPQVVGVLLDALEWSRTWLETEINGAADNPLIDPETGEAMHGGNFYGGHVCFVADSLKNAVANVADLLDRQMALLCSPDTSNGLPENLVGRTGEDKSAHHGFKAMQIAASALTAEALKLTMPASVFSRSTECHNQDKVSMGTIASRDLLRVVELVETVVAIEALAVAQAVDLRQDEECPARALGLRDAIRVQVPFNDADRRQDRDIAAVLRMLRADELPIGES